MINIGEKKEFSQTLNSFPLDSPASLSLGQFLGWSHLASIWWSWWDNESNNKLLLLLCISNIEGKRRQNQTRRPLHRPPWFHQHCLDQRAKANQVNYAASVEIYTSGGGGWWLNGEFLCLFALNLIYSNYYDTVALDWQIFAGQVKHQDIKTKELLLKQTKSSCWI